MTEADERPELLLRPWSVSDTDGLRDAIDEDLHHLKPWLSWTLEEPATPERTRRRLATWVAAYESGAELRYAIVPADDPRRILGGTSLKHRCGERCRDIGYWVRKSAARAGVAAAAVARLVILTFEESGNDRMIAQCDVLNERSAAFAEAQGFAPIGEGEIAYPDGTRRPVRRFELTRDGYERLRDAFARRAMRVRLTG